MNNSEFVEIIKSIIKSKTANVEKVTLEFFDQVRDETINNLKLIFPQFLQKENAVIQQLYTTAVNEYLSVYPVDIDPTTSLIRKELPVWLTEERKKTLPVDYIKRYLTLLVKEGRSEKVIEETRSSSEKILGKLGDPKSDAPFYVKGLVVGSVQSGKTGNFNAVINRAIDAGYSLIIVLSGIMEDLRGQTQLRIENDVVGEGTIDIQKDTKGEKGVGKIERFGEQGNQNVRQAFSITSYKSDFRKSVKETDFSLNNKNILVCKKNTGVLKNLVLWLNDYLNENKEKHDIPLLIIDDEADNASLNNLGHKGREYASKINGHIRVLLNLFTRKTYLGYTATPFANVLQDRNEHADGKWKITYKHSGQTVEKEFSQVDNIFPDDFIELLNPPSNYIGAKQIFETVLDETTKKIPLVVPVYDHEAAFPSRVTEQDGILRAAGEDDDDSRASRRDDKFPKYLPDSLKDAIDCFILSIALRLSRKPDMMDSKLYNPHHSMLVHISRFIPWQNETKTLIEEYISESGRALNLDMPNDPASVYGRFEKVWNKYYATIVSTIRYYLPEGYKDEFLISRNFSFIKPLLVEAVKGIETKAVNSDTKDKLQYIKDSSGNGKKYIAVGGNRLSRGFTLEGLTINYFIRNTDYSDTLLQMGRWFGYRPGYLDCCKLFTTADAIEKFDSTTRAIEELEADFKKMHREGKTPKDFILRVRKHPGTLKITRPAILKNTKEVNWSYQDQLEQTTQFSLKPDLINKAWAAFNGLIDTFNGLLQEGENFFTIKTDTDGLIKFLELPNTFYNYENDIRQIRRFIELCNNKGKLKNWTVAIRKKGEKGNRYLADLSDPSGIIKLPGTIQLTTRRGPAKDDTLRTAFVRDHVFKASGRSANIVTRGFDLAVLLDRSQIERAEAEFRAERKEFFISKHMTEAQAEESIKAIKTMPEKIYRRKISDQEGLLLIYLIDTVKVFRHDEPTDNEDLSKMAKDIGFNLDIPLIGYAIGFPPISPDPGGVYAQGDYNIEEDGAEVEEWNPELETVDE